MSAAPTNTRSYDPNIIIRAANDKLTAGDLVGGQTLFQSALLNWVDDAREGCSSSYMDADSLKEAIATLWIAYAHFLIQAKQFKSATEAFEQAILCPIGGTMGRVWLEYARFLQDRNKLRTAQQVFLKALVKDGGAALDEQDQNLLWNEFLELSRETTENPDLTLRELQQAIQEEQNDVSAAPALKRPRLASKDDDDLLATTEEPAFRTHVVTPSDVELEIQTLIEAVQNVPNDPTFMAAWLVRDGDAPPQPPLSLFEGAPPKLSDPTGKDLLGEELALAVVTRLLEPSGDVVLQVCRALWMWTYLKEQQSLQARQNMDESIMEQHRQLQTRLEERLSVAGAAEAAVRSMNQQELQAFENKAQEERRALWSKLAWEARQVQWASQQVLNKLQMPGFMDSSTAGTTADTEEVKLQARVCSYLHSAFFLRRRIGEKAHVTMLTSQRDRLEQYVAAQTAAGTSSRTPPPPPLQPTYPPTGGGGGVGGAPPPQYATGGGGMMVPPPPPLPHMMGYPGYPPPPQQVQAQQMPLGAYPPPMQQYPPPPPNYGNNNPPPRW